MNRRFLIRFGILFLIGAIAAILLIVAGVWRLLWERQEIENRLMQERSLLASRAAAVLSAEQDRCQKAILQDSKAPLDADCQGLKESDSPVHWFVYRSTDRSVQSWPSTEETQKLRTHFEAALPACNRIEQDASACLQLAGELAASPAALDSLAAFYGLSILQALNRAEVRAESYYLLRARLEKMLFLDALHRHHGQILQAQEEGKKALGVRNWIRLGRYRITTGKGSRQAESPVVGFDCQPRSEDLQSFLVAKGVLEETDFQFLVRAEPGDEGAGAEVSSAFVDPQVGFLLVKESGFGARISQAKHQLDWQLLLFAAAGLVLLVSLFFVFWSVRLGLANLHSRENFVASVSHELRSPLGGIGLMLETLLSPRSIQPEKQREYLEQIQREVARMSALSENILALARLQRGHRIHKEPFSPLILAQRVLEQVAELAKHRQVDLVLSLDQAACSCIADPALTQLALQNLLNNAIKFSPPGCKVVFGAAVQNQGLCWSVEDSGPGISESEQKRIFDWFYRTGDEVTRETPGTGLGLALVAEVAKRHRGRVTVKSRQGLGSRFELWIPGIGAIADE